MTTHKCHLCSARHDIAPFRVAEDGSKRSPRVAVAQAHYAAPRAAAPVEITEAMRWDSRTGKRLSERETLEVAREVAAIRARSAGPFFLAR
jgi:hypothetical protein